MGYKILALDLDGTLLDNDKKISKENKKYLNKVKEKNIEVVLTTGRHIQRVTQYYNELELNSPMILLNGAEVRENFDDVIKRSFVSKEAMIKLYDLSVKYKANFRGYNEDDYIWGFNEGDHVSNKNWNKKMLDLEWMRFSFSHEDKNVVIKLRKEIERLEDIQLTYTGEHNIHCARKGITKKYGLEILSEYLNIDIKDIIAVGDDMNDYDLIKNVGLGIAMGNSVEKIKDVADVVTKNNTENGVAEVIKKYIL